MRDAQAQLATDFVGAGDAVCRFESALGVVRPERSVACGTSALHFASLALDIRGDDDAVVPTYVCRSAVEPVCETGRPVGLCDAGPDWAVNSAGSARRSVDELMRRLLGPDDTQFPHAVYAFQTSISVPGHAGLSADEHESCASALQEWLERDRPELLSRKQDTDLW